MPDIQHTNLPHQDWVQENAEQATSSQEGALVEQNPEVRDAVKEIKAKPQLRSKQAIPPTGTTFFAALAALAEKLEVEGPKDGSINHDKYI